MKYIMYLRRSSDSEDRQALSIPAQEDELRELARRRGLELVGEPLRESMSAKRPGRPIFAQMVELLNTSKADGILCWHGDRLARNSLDGGVLLWMLGEGSISEIVTPGKVFTGSADDKLLLTITFGMATKYSDDLSQNIKRGYKAAIERGRWPCLPKIGYVRDRETKEIVQDTLRFPLIQELWQRRLAKEPLSSIVQDLRGRGLTTNGYGKRGGGHIHISYAYRILRDPFYAGMMKYRGEVYPGNHPPVVSLDEFEQMQALLSQPSVPRTKTHKFAYRGLIRCATCNAIVTAERKTKPSGRTYWYYHCCRKSRRFGFCTERSVERRQLDAQIAVFLDDLRIPAELAEVLNIVLLEEERRRNRDRSAIRAQASIGLHAARDRASRLRRLLIDGVVSETDYETEVLRIRKQEADARLLAEGDGPSLIEPISKAASDAILAKERFLNGSDEEKHKLVSLVSSNLVLSGKTVQVVAKKPFDILVKISKLRNVCTRSDDVRNLILAALSSDNGTSAATPPGANSESQGLVSTSDAADLWLEPPSGCLRRF